MSARSNGAPLWFVRPIIDGVIREERGSLFAGTLAAMVEHIAGLHRKTGLEHAAAEVQP